MKKISSFLSVIFINIIILSPCKLGEIISLSEQLNDDKPAFGWLRIEEFRNNFKPDENTLSESLTVVLNQIDSTIKIEFKNSSFLYCYTFCCILEYTIIG
jgi:hypothetical protein